MALWVLVVEDDAPIRDMVRAILDDEGYAVLTAPDGLVALDRVREHPPDVIVLDYLLPGLDGPGFARVYRGQPGSHAPIVLMTAAVRPEARCAEVRAEGCLGKPFDLADLLAEVGRVLAAAPAA